MLDEAQRLFDLETFLICVYYEAKNGSRLNNMVSWFAFLLRQESRGLLEDGEAAILRTSLMYGSIELFQCYTRQWKDHSLDREKYVSKSSHLPLDRS
jgi:hypothetical protein